MVNVTVRLADGGLVMLGSSEIDAIYERLWETTQRGAIMAALKLADVRRSRSPSRLVSLSPEESAAFRDACASVAE